MSDHSMRFLKTKIVCTIGPASSEPRVIKRLCEAGMNMARLNMAYGTPDEIRQLAERLRENTSNLGHPVALLADLQGPKIRLGDVPETIELSPGQNIAFISGEKPDRAALPVTYANFAEDLSAGDRILIDDGQVELLVRKTDPPRVEAEVVIGGPISKGKGINLPGVHVSAPPLTDKDLSDIDLALEIGVDCLGLSFVRRASDIRQLRERIPDDILIIAKIEKGVALQDLDAILDASDAAMVARGDLGTELPFEQVPLVQKRIVRTANRHYRPVIIATQMLESMIERPRPTRAEISDVANAILDGTDAVMLAAETAAGQYPVESVEALTRVIGEIESTTLMVQGPTYDVPAGVIDEGEPAPTEVAIAGATAEAVRVLHSPAIVTFTTSGFTARVVSSRRPPVPIIAVTDTERVYRQLSMVWGVLPVLCLEQTYETMWAAARTELLRRGIAREGDRIVVTAGVPFRVSRTTNMVKIESL